MAQILTQVWRDVVFYLQHLEEDSFVMVRQEVISGISIAWGAFSSHPKVDTSSSWDESWPIISYVKTLDK